MPQTIQPKETILVEDHGEFIGMDFYDTDAEEWMGLFITKTQAAEMVAKLQDLLK